jgi:hypothetical protein
MILDTTGRKINVNGPEINEAVTRRIATLVGFGVEVEEIIARVGDTPATPARWIAFMARAIEAGTYEV